MPEQKCEKQVLKISPILKKTQLFLDDFGVYLKTGAMGPFCAPYLKLGLDFTLSHYNDYFDVLTMETGSVLYKKLQISVFFGASSQNLKKCCPYSKQYLLRIHFSVLINRKNLFNGHFGNQIFNHETRDSGWVTFIRNVSRPPFLYKAAQPHLRDRFQRMYYQHIQVRRYEAYSGSLQSI